jgi:hypothetical protein
MCLVLPGMRLGGRKKSWKGCPSYGTKGGKSRTAYLAPLAFTTRNRYCDWEGASGREAPQHGPLTDKLPSGVVDCTAKSHSVE